MEFLCKSLKLNILKSECKLTLGRCKLWMVFFLLSSFLGFEILPQGQVRKRLYMDRGKLLEFSVNLKQTVPVQLNGVYRQGY